MCRFINADAYASTGQGILGNNMFAYCKNSPINYRDNSGYLPASTIFPVCMDFMDSVSEGNVIDTNHDRIEPHPVDVFIFEAISTPNPFDYLMTYDWYANPMGIYKIGKGLSRIKTGVALIITPVPTLADEAAGLVLIFWGFSSVVSGIDMLGK